MPKPKINVFFSFFPYGGNGGCSTEHPNIRQWFSNTITACKADPRVGECFSKDFSDTPIPMLRNRAVIFARQAKADILVMVDSDQHPDLYLNFPAMEPKPFWDSSFDFFYERKLRGLVTCIGAPYCGPPPHELPYIFQWANQESDNPNCDFKLEMYTREQAALMKGIQQCAALPTGCILFDMELFEVTDPEIEFQALLKKHNNAEIALSMTRPWFYYEYKDIYEMEKASTEDVTCTRDMLLCAQARLGYNCMFANWDAWAGHWKPKCVGKPVLATSEQVNQKYSEAIKGGRSKHVRMMDIANLNAGYKPGLKIPVEIKPTNDVLLEVAK